MAKTMRITTSVSGNGITASSGYQEETADELIAIDQVIPASTADLASDLDLIVAKIKMLYLKCDKDITIETNSTSSPGDTLTLQAGEAITDKSLLTVNITQWFLNNPGLTQAVLTGYILYDPT